MTFHPSGSVSSPFALSLFEYISGGLNFYPSFRQHLSIARITNICSISPKLGAFVHACRDHYLIQCLYFIAQTQIADSIILGRNAITTFTVQLRDGGIDTNKWIGITSSGPLIINSAGCSAMRGSLMPISSKEGASISVSVYSH